MAGATGVIEGLFAARTVSCCWRGLCRLCRLSCGPAHGAPTALKPRAIAINRGSGLRTARAEPASEMTIQHILCGIETICLSGRTTPSWALFRCAACCGCIEDHARWRRKRKRLAAGCAAGVHGRVNVGRVRAGASATGVLGLVDHALCFSLAASMASLAFSLALSSAGPAFCFALS